MTAAGDFSQLLADNLRLQEAIHQAQIGAAGADARDKVSISYANPFASYALGGGWTLTAQAEITYNWEADSGKRTTLPASFIVSKVTHFGQQPVSLALGYKHFVEAPNGQLDHGVRFVVNFLFPK